jgi:hypothetical protein
MWCGCLDVAQRRAVNEMRSASSPSLAVRNSSSPKGWSQKWAHELSTTANHSEISTSKALRGLPWAQGAAGSNPAAPTNKISLISTATPNQIALVGQPWVQAAGQGCLIDANLRCVHALP